VRCRKEEKSIEAYLCESALVQNFLLEPCKSAGVRSQRRPTGRAGRRACDEGARQEDLGRWHLGLDGCAKHRP
jgi:hypothetical protein